MILPIIVLCLFVVDLTQTHLIFGTLCYMFCSLTTVKTLNSFPIASHFPKLIHQINLKR